MSEDKEYKIMLLMLLGFTLIVIGFIIEFINLYSFKRCYINDFEPKTCIKYKNY